MYARSLLVLLSTFTVLLLHAQNGARVNTPFDKAHFADAEGLKNAQAAIRKGDGLFRHGGRDTDAALVEFEKAYAFNPDNAELNYKMGLCHLNGRQHHLSLPYFQAAAALDNTLPHIQFLLGAAYQLNARWDEAIAAYQAHITASGGFPDPEPLYNTAERRMIQCKNGRSLQSAATTGQVTNLGGRINGLGTDYGVLLFPEGDRIGFTSRRATDAGIRINKNTGEPYEDILVAARTTDGWGAPTSIGAPVNTEFNDASVGLFPDGRTLLLYRDAKGPGDLFTSTCNNGVWSVPEPLPPTINSPSNETSAWPSPDGKTLYFVSDREGGVGGLDIWISQWDATAGTWGPARNPGPSVNSIEDEDGVFVHPDGHTLYFSSKGHTTMGGFDVFRTSQIAGRWTTPENLGWPVNSPDDDLFFVLTKDGNTGYFNSVRAGGFGEDDLYRVDLIKKKLSDETASMLGGAENAGQEMVTLKGRISDGRNSAGMEAIVEVVDPADGHALTSLHSDPHTGEYLAVVPAGKGLMVRAYNAGFLPGSAPDGDIALAHMERGASTVLHGIHFAEDGTAMQPGLVEETGRLISLMRANPELRIEVGAYADGTSREPLPASQRRAQAVVNHLAQNGIALDRLVAKGLGKLPEGTAPESVRVTVL